MGIFVLGLSSATLSGQGARLLSAMGAWPGSTRPCGGGGTTARCTIMSITAWRRRPACCQGAGQGQRCAVHLVMP